MSGKPVLKLRRLKRVEQGECCISLLKRDGSPGKMVQWVRAPAVQAERPAFESPTP